MKWLCESRDKLASVSERKKAKLAQYHRKAAAMKAWRNIESMASAAAAKYQPENQLLTAGQIEADGACGVALGGISGFNSAQRSAAMRRRNEGVCYCGSTSLNSLALSCALAKARKRS